MKKMALYMIMMMAVLGCAKEGGGLMLNDPFSIFYGKLYNSSEYNISIVLDSVLQDSRCPTGVECIWAGNAAVRFIFTEGNNSAKFILNTTLSPKDTTIAGFKIELISLKPYPVYLHEIKQQDYIAEIKISR